MLCQSEAYSGKLYFKVNVKSKAVNGMFILSNTLKCAAFHLFINFGNSDIFVAGAVRDGTAAVIPSLLATFSASRVV